MKSEKLVRLMRLQTDIISLPKTFSTAHKPAYDHRFKKWYPKQKAEYDKSLIDAEYRCDKLALMVEHINTALSIFIEIDMKDTL